jgi:hypothetical protein
MQGFRALSKLSYDEENSRWVLGAARDGYSGGLSGYLSGELWIPQADVRNITGGGIDVKDIVADLSIANLIKPQDVGMLSGPARTVAWMGMTGCDTTDLLKASAFLPNRERCCYWLMESMIREIVQGERDESLSALADDVYKYDARLGGLFLVAVMSSMVFLHIHDGGAFEIASSALAYMEGEWSRDALRATLQWNPDSGTEEFVDLIERCAVILTGDDSMLAREALKRLAEIGAMRAQVV